MIGWQIDKRKSVQKIQMSVRLLYSEDTKVRVKRLLKQRRSVSFWDIQTLVSGFNMRVFTLMLRNYLNFWQRGWTSVSLNFRSLTFRISTDCMISSFKVTYAISVNCRFYFPWRNRTLSVWDSKLFCHKFHKVLNSGHRWFQFAACHIMFYPRSIISLAELQHIF